MRTIIHLSDIHFGRVDYALLDPLIETVHAAKPDVVVVSGDLTQRARSHQFLEARTFLDMLPRPQIVVPGNHDVPLYNVFSRFARPLDKYKKFITEDLEPFHADEEIAVLGVNTARSLTIKSGRINERQIETIQNKFCALDDKTIKILVTHHPFDLPAGVDQKEIVGRAERAMKALTHCGADVLLSGHLHLSHIAHTAERYKVKNRSALVIQAGTATSTRGRGETNSFNLIRAEHPFLEVQKLEWQPAQKFFVPTEAQKFISTPKGWKPALDDK